MNWKQWKRGLFIACLTAVATGLATITIGVTWTQAGLLTLALIGKDMGLYLAQHPVDNIQDTTFTTKPPTDNK